MPHVWVSTGSSSLFSLFRRRFDVGKRREKQDLASTFDEAVKGLARPIHKSPCGGIEWDNTMVKWAIPTDVCGWDSSKPAFGVGVKIQRPPFDSAVIETLQCRWVRGNKAQHRLSNRIEKRSPYLA
jgi:hypothetical protein